MRIACIVSAYRNPDQLTRLVRRLDSFGFESLIHIDRKHLARFEQTTDEIERIESATLLPSHSVAWGSFGHVKATLKGLRELASRESLPEYTFLLTGQDYPIKPAESIASYLSALNGNSVIEHFELPWHFWGHDHGGRDRYERYYLPVAGKKLLRLPLPRVRKFPNGLQPFGGSSYWCLGADAVEYVTEFVAANPEYVRFFKHVRIPDELFFQTILANSDLRQRLTSGHIHCMEWDEGAAHPKIFGDADIEKLAASPMPFARKFDIATSPTILDSIDFELIDS